MQATCAICGKTVVVLPDGSPKRSCEHSDAAVFLHLDKVELHGDAVAAFGKVNEPKQRESAK